MDEFAQSPQITVFIVESHLGAGVVLNALLFYLVRRFSRASLGTYKYLLAAFASFDIFLSLLHLVMHPSAVITGTMFGVITNTGYESRNLTCIYASFFTVPFALMNIHFIYRYWSVASPHLIALFSNKKFIALISLWPVAEFVAWYVICYWVMTGDVGEAGTLRLRDEYARRHGVVLNDVWIVLNYP